jgi:membrane protein
MNSGLIERLRTQLEGWYAGLDRRLGGRLSLIVRTALAFDQDGGPLMARSIAYYALFAVFPALLLLIVIASAVLNSEEVQETVLSLVTEHMPIALDIVATNIEHLLSTRETVGLVALVGLVWSASGVFSAIYRAVNRAWGIPKSKLVLSEKLYGLAIVSIIGTLFLLTLSIGPIMSLIRAWQVPVLGWQPAAPLAARPGTDRLIGWLSALVPAVLSVGAFVLMYRTMPRTGVRWRDVWLGGLIAGLVWEAGQHIFAWYLSNFASYNVIYGSVGTIIGFLLWSYLSAQIFLLGAEFTAEYSRWRRAGRLVETRPLREWMADWSPLKGIEEGR